jgi:hemolysin activation/secretion protein
LFIDSNSNVATVGTLGVLGKGQIVGARLMYPFTAGGAGQSLTLGMDYKHFRNVIALNASPGLNTPISYVNLSLTYAGVWRSDARIGTLNLAADFGPRGLANNSIAFESDRFQARSNYFYLRGDGALNFLLPKAFRVMVRAAGQLAAEPLVANEDYSIAGVDAVRGYLESEELGDSAIKGTLQLQSPPLQRHALQLGDVFTFYDAGRAETIQPLPGQPPHEILRSWGIGADLLPGQKVTGSLTWAHPLDTASVTRADTSRVLFVVHGAF